MNHQLYTTLNTGKKMPLLGLGVYDMYNKEAEGAIETAIEIGYRLIDTASMYDNEKEVGNAVRKSGIDRNEIFITTKVNNTEQGYDATLKAFDSSQKKLNLEYIDLYLVHWPIKGKRKETWKALEYLYQQKAVKAIGVANYLLPFLTELETYATVTPALNQVEFTPFLYLKEELDYVKRHNIQLQSYSPLTRGEKLSNPVLKSLSQKYNKTEAQVILRWNLQLGVSTIPKSSNNSRLKENFDIFDFILSEEDMQRLNGLNENYRVCDNPMEMI